MRQLDNTMSIRLKPRTCTPTMTYMTTFWGCFCSFRDWLRPSLGFDLFVSSVIAQSSVLNYSLKLLVALADFEFYGDFVSKLYIVDFSDFRRYGNEICAVTVRH